MCVYDKEQLFAELKKIEEAQPEDDIAEVKELFLLLSGNKRVVDPPRKYQIISGSAKYREDFMMVLSGKKTVFLARGFRLFCRKAGRSCSTTIHGMTFLFLLWPFIFLL